MKLSEIHNCPKCQGKIVNISIDAFGNTCCGYCGQRVNYNEFYDEVKKIKKAREWKK